MEFSAAIATFPSVSAASKAVSEIMRFGLNPAALELMAPECITLMNREDDLDLDVFPTLLMEFHGTTSGQLAEVLEMAKDLCRSQQCTHFQQGVGRSRRDRMFKARHELGEMIVRNHPEGNVLIVDVAVPISAYSKLTAYIRREMTATPPRQLFFQPRRERKCPPQHHRRKEQRAPVEYHSPGRPSPGAEKSRIGGNRHWRTRGGPGQAQLHGRRAWRRLVWMKRVKDLFDPHGILNPGKIFQTS